MVASWYFIRGFTAVRTVGFAVIPRVHASGGARGQYLGHHRFCLMSWRLGDGWILYLRCWFSVKQTLTCIYVYRSVILPFILRTIWMTNAIIGILVPCDAKIYLIKCMWVSDLHFMVLWFCLIYWKLFDGLMLYWGYWFSVTQTLNWNYICRSVTYISWSSDFVLYLEDYLMDKYHNCNIGSMWCKYLPHKMCVGQWPTFHGPVIWSYNLKTIWWINLVLEILIQCDTNIELKLYI